MWDKSFSGKFLLDVDMVPTRAIGISAS